MKYCVQLHGDLFSSDREAAAIYFAYELVNGFRLPDWLQFQKKEAKPGKEEKMQPRKKKIVVDAEKIKENAMISTDFMNVLNGSEKYKTTDNTTAFIGVDKQNNDILLSMKECTHVLVAGATGSGKSVMLHALISSLMEKNQPNTASFLLVDPKRVEFFDYSKSDMLYGGHVFEDMDEAVSALSDIVDEMNNRFGRLQRMHVRSIDDIEGKGVAMPRIYIVIDELSFIMQDKEIRKEAEPLISKIAMMGRAAGIHLILCTQNPNRKTITGNIQANIPTVIGLATRTATDSRMIIQSNELTRLQGRGDAIMVSGLEETHFQGAYVSSEDVQKIVSKNGNHLPCKPSVMQWCNPYIEKMKKLHVQPRS